jgi:cytochrome P450
MTDSCPLGHGSLRDTYDQDPYPLYDELLSQPRARWDGGVNSWLASSYEACKEAYRVDQVSLTKAEQHDNVFMTQLYGGSRPVTALFGDEHRRMHHWWLGQLSPTRLAEQRENIVRPIVHDMVDRFIEEGRADLASDFSDQIPVRVTAALCGLPWDDDDWIGELHALNRRFMALLDRRGGWEKKAMDRSDGRAVDQTEHERAVADALDAAAGLNELLMPYVLDRRSGTGDDLISQLWRDGPELLPDWSPEDVLAQARVLIAAGVDTTQYGATNALYVLLLHPEVREEITASEKRLGHFIEESLRLYAPAQFRSRRASEDLTLTVGSVAADQSLTMVLAAANRDPARYANPTEVDLDRKAPRDHLAFAFGPRSCVGANLARAELLEIVQATLDRLPDMRLDPEREHPVFAGWSFRSFRPLHVVFTPGNMQGAPDRFGQGRSSTGPDPAQVG